MRDLYRIVDIVRQIEYLMQIGYDVTLMVDPSSVSKNWLYRLSGNKPG